jgi:hypothetical protein
MSKSVSMQEKANEYDRVKVNRTEVDRALNVLKEFRQKYPFTENLRAIEYLDPDKLFKVSPDEVGEFFRLLENSLKPLGRSTLNNSNIYRNARLQISEFKNLLRAAVDNRKSLAQKLDAPWERIGGLGQDKQLAKEIIFCFNYESGKVLPIFNNQHLRHFVNRVSDIPSGQTKYLTPGQEYEHYTAELVGAKDKVPATRSWDPMYFAVFLNQSYPPPDSKPAGTTESAGKAAMMETNEQLELRAFVKLLADLQSKGKISGQQFREYREQWTSQQPNDRELLAIRLKTLLIEPKPKPNMSNAQSDELPKRPARQRL